MARNKRKNRIANTLAVCFWLCAWQAASVCIGQKLILVSPLEVCGALLALLPTADFWQTAAFSAGRIIGGFLLALAGLGWRCWVRNLMVLALCVLLFQGIWYGLQALGERPRVRGRWPEIVLGLAGGAALVGLALFLLLFVFFLRDYDRVSEWEGQTVVAEYRGIDRGSHQCPRVCRYESWLLRGEELGPGR